MNGTDLATGAAIDRVDLWIVIIGLGLGSFALRFAFLGLIGKRQMPEWLLRHLRYTPVAVLPALVAPLVVWPGATGGEMDPPRLTAALVTLALGVIFRRTLLAIVCGLGTLYLMLWLMG
ncbi:Branched-chain amino acid transport protein (AzlD) [Pseudooceanicola marinus]|uniref:Branched-chain amino acid transport protein (AzlD) n=1 Tax=Pseudooceanicola marinus TaxID=396013 RepID=A0A1X6YCS5_9RHOB|nr:AzlD domain-containing protein [Pseudooceanicola marinus]PJE32999.1 AzlD domain-containing protein [Pseudooceanicola marinus]SLN17022.1 Branched-chain amino acid transport protein (AzlD) [Pseudooceanicola marinus]